MLITFLLIGLMSGPILADPPERSLRGNSDIPTRDIAQGLGLERWTELKNKEYNIYFKVLVEALPGGSVRTAEIIEHDPASISEEVAERMMREVELFYPQIGSKVPHGMVHVILYRHTSEGPLALIYARGVKVPEHVTVVEPFIKIMSLAPAEPGSAE